MNNIDVIPTIGSLLPDDFVGYKDAIHIPVISVTANRTLSPGESVNINGNPTNDLTQIVGIVDPFLEVSVSPGENFWIFISPGSIKSIRHEWQHPKEEQQPKPKSSKDKAKEKLEAYAHDLGYSLTYLIDKTKAWVEEKEYWSEGSRFSGGEYLPADFWDCYEQYTQSLIDEKSKVNSFFACSC